MKRILLLFILTNLIIVKTTFGQCIEDNTSATPTSGFVVDGHYQNTIFYQSFSPGCNGDLTKVLLNFSNVRTFTGSVKITVTDCDFSTYNPIGFTPLITKIIGILPNNTDTLIDLGGRVPILTGHKYSIGIEAVWFSSLVVDLLGYDNDTYSGGNCWMTVNGSKSNLSNMDLYFKAFIEASCGTLNSHHNVSICPNQLPYTWNGTVYSTAGNYAKHFTASNGCDSTATLHLSVSNPRLLSEEIVGDNKVCVGSSLFLSHPIVGGTWSSSATSRATVSSTDGEVVGRSAGTTTISYQVVFNPTCSGIVSKTINSYSNPAIPSINYSPINTVNPQAGAVSPLGGLALCKNRTFILRGTPSGGTWFAVMPGMSVTPIDSRDASVTTFLGGNSSISYTVTNANNCSSTRSISAYIVNCGSKQNKDEKNTKVGFSVFPNPSKGFFNVKLDYAATTQDLVVFDVYGKTVLTQKVSGLSTTINHKLSKGFYLVSINNIVQKLIVE